MDSVLSPHTAALSGTNAADLRAYIGALQRACEKHPHSADLLTCLGVAYSADKHYGRAKEAFERAVDLNPAHFFAQLRYAEMLLARGYHRAAEQRAKMAEAAARTRSERSMSKRLLTRIRTR